MIRIPYSNLDQQATQPAIQPATQPIHLLPAKYEIKKMLFLVVVVFISIKQATLTQGSQGNFVFLRKRFWGM